MSLTDGLVRVHDPDDQDPLTVGPVIVEFSGFVRPLTVEEMEELYNAGSGRCYLVPPDADPDADEPTIVGG